jgi:hypothetical protein
MPFTHNMLLAFSYALVCLSRGEEAIIRDLPQHG